MNRLKVEIMGWQRKPSFEFPPGSGNYAATVWFHTLARLYVMRSLATLKDGSEWIHLSISHKDRLPTWVEITKAKNSFIGEHREAYQVLPAKKDYVNISETCLHLWAPLDEVRRVANLQDLVMEKAL